MTTAIVGGLLLLGCGGQATKENKTSQPAKKAPSAAVTQVCTQVNAGAEVPSPLPQGLPFSLEQAVREYQLGYGKGDQGALVGRIRVACRKEGVPL